MTVLYRVFIERNDYTRGFQADFLYYYAALLLGALLPVLLANLGNSRLPGVAQPGRAAGGGTGTRGTALLRMSLIGVAAALSPLAVWLMIGDRPEAALLVGLAVGSLGVSRRAAWDEALLTSSLERLLAPTIALSAVQFTHLLAPLALRTRGQRLEILAGVTLVVLLGIAISAYWERKAHQSTALAS
jgi:hypothetical protein